MCEPTTMLVLSTVFSVAGGLGKARAQRRTGEYNSAVARNNAILAEHKADAAIVQGGVDEATQRRKTEAIKGSQKVAFGAGNIQLGSGTPADVLAGTAIVGEMEAQTIRQNARKEAYGYSLQAKSFESQAELDIFEGEQKEKATLLSTATNVAGKWYTAKSAA